ncbi:MAG: adenylate kinase [Propionibacteriaceae bacterium]
MPSASVDDVRFAQRILVYGVTGSGKSTAATHLGEILNLPVHLVDDEIGWLPGWIERPVPEQKDIAERLAAEDQWIFDSAYGHWRHAPIARADIIIALDYPRWLSFTRLLNRTIYRIVDKKSVCNGNIETWSSIFSKESILRWHFATYKRKHKRMIEWESSTQGPKVYRLTNQNDVNKLLETLRG